MAVQQKPARFMALEGVRGIAAISVVLWHTTYMFFAFTIVGAGVQHAKFESFLYGTPLMAFISGSWAVAIFFVLSGFVLSIKFFTRGDSDGVKSQLIRRYPRLMIPAAAVCLVACVIMLLGLNHNPAVNQFSHSDWLASMWSFVPSIPNALYDGTIGVFTSNASATQYDPVLWTMYWEFLGSLLVFGFLMFVGKNRKRWVGYGLLAALTYSTYLFGFLIGMIFADLYGHDKFKKLNLGVALILVAVGFYLGGIITTSSPYYSFLPQIGGMQPGMFIWFVRALAAGLVVYVVLATPRITKLMERRWISGIGKYTYALYLMHKLVLFSFTGWVFLHLQSHLGYNHAAAAAFIVSIPVIAVATVLFERYVDRPAIIFARKFGAWFTSEAPGTLAAGWQNRRIALASRLYMIEAKYSARVDAAKAERDITSS
ncbi:MAG TPA: acyltransferase [Candidatus Saccharimonadaceae bacterium]|nr:acyltransferase [Candidatus Saccharimonadaceae bacterium]